MRQLNNKLNRVEEDKQMIISARKDRMTLLGQDIPKICHLINENQNRFVKKPLGPIGIFLL